LNPEYEIRLYDDESCKEFLLKEYSQLHVDIFNFIPDGPIKADFWRVCILNKYGGLYIDADIEPLIPLKEYIEDDDDFVTCISNDFGKPTTLWESKPIDFQLNPHFLICNKNNKTLQKCIDEYIELYKKKEYSYWHWSICKILKISEITEKRSHICNINNEKYKLIYELDSNTCEYNGVVVFHNRYKTYKEHNFVKSISYKINNYRRKMFDNKFISVSDYITDFQYIT
jgi:mannosyltransferase OCH1-like enzyme